MNLFYFKLYLINVGKAEAIHSQSTFSENINFIFLIILYCKVINCSKQSLKNNFPMLGGTKRRGL